MHVRILCAVWCCVALGCAAEEGYTPITDDREDNESLHSCFEEEDCDIVFEFSYLGSETEEIDVSMTDPFAQKVLPKANGIYSYDAESNRSGWSFSYWGTPKGDYSPLVWGRAGALTDVEFSWRSGKSAYTERFNPEIGESCGLTLDCSENLECMKLSPGIGQGYTCVTRCFTDAQCSAECEPAPTGELAVEGVEGVCRSSAIQG